jgi:hypothetical protein
MDKYRLDSLEGSGLDYLDDHRLPGMLNPRSKMARMDLPDVSKLRDDDDDDDDDDDGGLDLKTKIMIQNSRKAEEMGRRFGRSMDSSNDDYDNSIGAEPILPKKDFLNPITPKYGLLQNSRDRNEDDDDEDNDMPKRPFKCF